MCARVRYVPALPGPVGLSAQWGTTRKAPLMGPALRLLSTLSAGVLQINVFKRKPGLRPRRAGRAASVSFSLYHSTLSLSLSPLRSVWVLSLPRPVFKPPGHIYRLNNPQESAYTFPYVTPPLQAQSARDSAQQHCPHLSSGEPAARRVVVGRVEHRVEEREEEGRVGRHRHAPFGPRQQPVDETDAALRERLQRLARGAIAPEWVLFVLYQRIADGRVGTSQ